MSQAPIDLAAHRKRRAERRREQHGDFDVAAAMQRIEAGHEHTGAPVFGPADVPCARCGGPVAGNARRCPHCGVHFSGLAEEFSTGTAQRSQRTTMIVAALLILCLVLAAVFDWMD